MKRTLAIFALAASGTTFAASETPITLTLGAKLHSGGWTGENKGSITGDIESTNGKGMGLSVGLRRDRWFSVLALQTGSYDFDDKQPIYDTNPIGAEEESLTVDSGFFSIGVGYQLTPYFALQGGFKSHGQTWEKFNRDITYVGVGVGATGFYPLSKTWTLYGTLGLNNMTIEDDSGNNIGDAGSSSLELGAAYRLTPVSSLSFGFKNEAVVAEFDSGNEQEHNLANLFIGYNHGIRF